jgi:hypothetical protein
MNGIFLYGINILNNIIPSRLVLHNEKTNIFGLSLCGMILYNNKDPKNTTKQEMIINNIFGINLKFCLYKIIAVIIINIKNGKIYFKKSSKIYPIPITRKRPICTKMDIRPFILSPINSFIF